MSPGQELFEPRLSALERRLARLERPRSCEELRAMQPQVTFVAVDSEQSNLSSNPPRHLPSLVSTAHFSNPLGKVQASNAGLGGSIRPWVPHRSFPRARGIPSSPSSLPSSPAFLAWEGPERAESPLSAPLWKGAQVAGENGLAEVAAEAVDGQPNGHGRVPAASGRDAVSHGQPR